jgi:hypothetical protein
LICPFHSTDKIFDKPYDPESTVRGGSSRCGYAYTGVGEKPKKSLTIISMKEIEKRHSRNSSEAATAYQGRNKSYKEPHVRLRTLRDDKTYDRDLDIDIPRY